MGYRMQEALCRAYVIISSFADRGLGPSRRPPTTSRPPDRRLERSQQALARDSHWELNYADIGSSGRQTPTARASFGYLTAMARIGVATVSAGSGAVVLRSCIGGAMV
jgi:hypothetical protein